MSTVTALVHAIHNGTYTIVLGNTEDYITLRVKDSFLKEKDVLGRKGQMIEYLSGPDNEDDFTGCAFLWGRKANLWKRFADDGRLAQAIKVLTDGGDKEAGERYAMESGNCYCCGHKLTVPASLHRGLGPVCAARQGVLG